MKRSYGIIPLMVLILCASCQKQAEDVVVKEPDRVTVQHILISFKGSDPRITVTRTREEAEKLAHEIFERAKKGENFDGLVKEFTDDQHPGIYKMSNFDVPPQTDQEEYSRSGMVKSFGDVSFKLPVNGIGMAEYDPDNSKYGWHIIKRLK
jgi:parvulin-like peptidyl-prolyl isomerase